MTAAGWITFALCWTLVTGFSVFLIVKTLRTKENDDPAQR